MMSPAMGRNLRVSYHSREQQEEYLRRFGYLDSHDTKDAVSNKHFSEAVHKFQKMTGLKKTGTVNKDTIQQMEKRRCGLSDFAKGNKKSSEDKWSKTHLEYSFDNYSPDMSKEDIKHEFKKAFQMWSDVTPLTFTKVDSSSADITIKFTSKDHGDHKAFDGSGEVVAYATSLEKGEIHFDEDETWGLTDDDESTNVITTAAHEIGHALGLDHSDVEDAVMFPYVQEFSHDFDLHESDIDGIQEKYGAKKRSHRRPLRPTPRPRRTTPKPNPV
jgi:hypothetical protein